MRWYGGWWRSRRRQLRLKLGRAVSKTIVLPKKNRHMPVFLAYSYRIAYNIPEVMYLGEAHCESEHQRRRRDCGQRVPDLQGDAAHHLAGGHGCQ